MNIVTGFERHHLAYWVNADEVATARPIVMRAPEGMESCSDCQAVITTMADGSTVVRVAWKPNEIDLAHLATGGTVWLSTWGGLLPHMVEVQPGTSP